MMIDFNKGQEIFNKFLGSENKKTIIYNDEIYMIKFPDPIRDKHNPLSYMNNQFSEHIGCEIFKSCGIPTQETVIGKYILKNGQEKIVVGCKDFTQYGSKLYEFSKLTKAIVSDNKKYNATIENVYHVIKESEIINNKNEIINRFWDMFIIDALIGNTDRHFDNWGLLVNKTGKNLFAPIYDCGSSLGALLSDEEMEILLNNFTEFKNKEFNIASCYSMNGKRIFYHEIFKNSPTDLIFAIKRTVPKININRIKKIINSTEIISDTRKEYLNKSVNMRYTEILIPALERYCENENECLNEIDNDWDLEI
ncbi:HipA domain-containing protein [Tissierella praeacuta]|uniref:HipA domain-containing protein n=1 Tax=Tissierella praeacuta TaxID=43131 RepID=UPI0028AA8827|nr:HipA domain-containing protein [Tissierella praeacuta]